MAPETIVIASKGCIKGLPIDANPAFTSRVKFLPMKLPAISSLAPAILAGISLVTPALAAVNIDYASIGNINNANDGATGSLYGAVAYAYQIARNETTISQYSEFLNAVAKTDTYSLYSTQMTTSNINGISRSGVSGSFTYSVTSGSANKPITYVSWFDAARFTNWMHNGQLTGAQNSLTTEDGAYTLNGAVSGVSFSKNVGATVWIPSENEWYKAAYYDPNKGGAGVGGYWEQVTQSNTVTGNTVGVAKSANFYDGDFVGSGTASRPTGNALTDVGAYGLNSDSAYGTNDQAGNVFEWNDAVVLDFGSARGLRGGSWDYYSINLGASYRDFNDETLEDNYVGFRVASIPEPTSLVLMMLASGMMFARRKR